MMKVILQSLILKGLFLTFVLSVVHLRPIMAREDKNIKQQKDVSHRHNLIAILFHCSPSISIVNCNHIQY